VSNRKPPVGNLVRTKDDLEKAVTFACSVPGVYGAVVVLGGDLAARGRLTLRSLNEGSTQD